MMHACRAYLTHRLLGLILSDGYTLPYADERCAEPRNIFFDELPRDFLKENDYAACCLPLRDASRRFGKLVGKSRSADKTAYALIRRRYTREVTFRCRLYAATAEELWGTATRPGLVDQFQQGIAEHRQFADRGGSVIKVDPQDTARPWDTATELERKLNRPALALVRVQFSGGIQTVTELPLIPDVTITPLVG